MPARVEPSVLVADDWRDYRLLDSGHGRKLEQAGPYRFVRPEPQALWRPRTEPAQWDGADAIFSPSGEEEETGRWRFTKALPETWPMHWDGMGFLSRPTPFRHLAFFPEHSVHWRFALGALEADDASEGDHPPSLRFGAAGKGRPYKPAQPREVLNLFGYTGLASLACARAGARVTHVDASKKAIGFARANQTEAGLTEAPIRWIVDDAHAFVRREVRRGRRYDGVILDPPKYGRGPNGEVWRIEEGLHPLLADCAQLLREDGPSRFLILTVYAVRMSFLALSQTARDATAIDGGVWEHGEMALPHAHDERILPTAIFVRWRG